jgi:hypothetical protein
MIFFLSHWKLSEQYSLGPLGRVLPMVWAVGSVLLLVMFFSNPHCIIDTGITIMNTAAALLKI